jgi:hypothetical protein
MQCHLQQRRLLTFCSCLETCCTSHRPGCLIDRSEGTATQRSGTVATWLKRVRTAASHTDRPTHIPASVRRSCLLCPRGTAGRPQRYRCRVGQRAAAAPRHLVRPPNPTVPTLPIRTRTRCCSTQRPRRAAAAATATPTSLVRTGRHLLTAAAAVQRCALARSAAEQSPVAEWAAARASAGAHPATNLCCRAVGQRLERPRLVLPAAEMTGFSGRHQQHGARPRPCNRQEMNEQEGGACEREVGGGSSLSRLTTASSASVGLVTGSMIGTPIAFTGELQGAC